MCRWAIHGINNVRRLLLITGKEVTTQNFQDEGDGKEEKAVEYVDI